MAIRLAITALISVPVLTAFGVHTAVAELDRATVEQCQRQDWPVSQHAAHAEFCRTYLINRP